MPATTRTSAPRRWVAALAVALLLAACGEAAPVAGADPGSEPAPAPAPTTTTESAPAAGGATTAAPTPDASDAGAAGAAGAAELSIAGLDGAALQGITQGAQGSLVVVGSDGSAAAAWSQSDGAWQRGDVEDAEDVDRLRTVASGAGGLVAFGGGDDQPSTGWTSDDGTVWTPFAAEGIDVRVNAVTADGAGWVAVGDRIAPEGGGSAAGVVLRSDDGVTWTVVTDRLRAGDGTVSDVAVGDGVVVAVGFDTAGGRIWRDPASQRRPIGGDVAGTSIQGVAATGDGFVALGRNLGDLRAVAWTSQDGETWERHDLEGDAFEPTDEVNDLTATDDGLVAAGSSPDGGVLWTSDDGLSWTRVAP
jgi:hypothetical protein